MKDAIITKLAPFQTASSATSKSTLTAKRRTEQDFVYAGVNDHMCQFNKGYQMIARQKVHRWSAFYVITRSDMPEFGVNIH